MAETYDIEQSLRLSQVIADARLHHVEPPVRYEPGHVFELAITGVCPAVPGQATLEVEKFIGGGFAGQVYRVQLTKLELEGEAIVGLEVGGTYAVKVIVPPSKFSVAFRNTVYWLAYQASFAAQVNPAAARTGVIWQKLIRRGAALRFEDKRCAADTYATFYEAGLGSYGEINEWIEGRNWNFEIDEEIFKRPGLSADAAEFSREYLAKKEFMADFVRLFHDMGAPEFARQYEWWTCKSQPNVLKRIDAGDGPADGLTALDFRAGLALLPYLPMSPVDFLLIIKGLKRGALVQFDRGDLKKLEAFIDGHGDGFEDLRPALEELQRVDPEYRASQPDLTRHAFKLLYSGKLRASVKAGLVQGWTVRGLADERHAPKLKGSFFAFWAFFLLGFVPLAGRTLRRLLCHDAYRRHMVSCLTDFDYLKRVFRVHQAQRLIDWHRAGRVSKKMVDHYLEHPYEYWTLRFNPVLMIAPPKWHRALTDWRFAKLAILGAIGYPIKFYFDAAFREQWLTSEIDAGAKEGMLSDSEHNHILESVPDPFIQKYLKCVAVHVCTLPITQIVSVVASLAATYYWFYVRGGTWAESVGVGAGVLAIFQVIPISPGSFCRGTYVLYLIIRERNIRNYWLAMSVGYFHYIGYLGFPLQMVSHFPALARFMGGRWATKMVGFIPVFGERGALLEHWMFDLFFNVPLTVKAWFERHPITRRITITLLALAFGAAITFGVWKIVAVLAAVFTGDIKPPELGQ